ncbi:MAG TPA: mechanosensitive ion channel domain-containing protein, partial [Bacteroidales bacterium]|nr:mechanosensitive ion channel domain-containing protein [Bacteroidales bacterium]
MGDLIFSVETLKLLMYAGIIAGVCVLIGTGINFLVYYFLRLYNKRRKSDFVRWFLIHTKNAVHLFTPSLLFLLSLPVLHNYDDYGVLLKAVNALFYISCAWLTIRIVYVFSDTILTKQEITEDDNIGRRKLYTQLQFLRRLIIIIVLIFYVSIILLNFESIRKLGAGILTSAGIAGLIIGFAAQRSLSNLLAGLQIAFSQPIKINDDVFLENEYGKVEEITLTYVIIKLWDMRRLVVPLNYFIERPFQNWTRVSAEIIGSVILQVDYLTPIDPIRNELKRILNESHLWDGKTSTLQVVNSNNKTLELRATMSASNGDNAWDLKCF